MSSNTPTGIGNLPPPTFESLTKPEPLHFFEYKPGMVVDNATYGRVRTKMCYADRREEKLDQMRQYYAQNKDYMSGQGANYMQGEMDKLQNSIDPSEQSISSGPTAAQQEYNQQQAENLADIDEMEKDPIYGAARGAGLSKKHAHAVSIMVDVLDKAHDFKEKPAATHDKIVGNTKFNVGPE